MKHGLRGEPCSTSGEDQGLDPQNSAAASSGCDPHLCSGQTKQNAIKRNAAFEPSVPDGFAASYPIPVLNEERRRAILDLLTHQGRVLVTELAHQFDTSQVTIRKDLEILHAHGLVHRTHGGALPSRDGALEDPTLREKEKLHHQEKLRIADSAVEKVKEGQVLILDSGTTTTAIARALRNFQNLTIITNAVNIAAELAGTAVEVILTGGTLRKNSFSLVGPIAEETLRRLSADLLFLGVDGFDVHFGLSTPNLLEAKVNRVMVEIAKKTVAVCDSSKFGRRSLSLIAPPSALHEVITDRAVPKSDIRALKQAGIDVTLV
jgi:DeoR family transcriptional regulator of aga operon